MCELVAWQYSSDIHRLHGGPDQSYVSHVMCINKFLRLGHLSIALSDVTRPVFHIVLENYFFCIFLEICLHLYSHFLRDFPVVHI